MTIKRRWLSPHAHFSIVVLASLRGCAGHPVSPGCFPLCLTAFAICRCKRTAHAVRNRRCVNIGVWHQLLAALASFAARGTLSLVGMLVPHRPCQPVRGYRPTLGATFGSSACVKEQILREAKTLPKRKWSQGARRRRDGTCPLTIFGLG